MHPPSRTRRVLKWTGVGLSLLILAAWVVSLQWNWWHASARFVITAQKGLILAQWSDQFDPYIVHDLRYMASTRNSSLGFLQPAVEYRRWAGAHYSSYLVLPFWLVLVVAGAPTVWLWDRDRRRIPPGHCQRCGYDLTGNTSGKCSECGMAKPKAAADAVA